MLLTYYYDTSILVLKFMNNVQKLSEIFLEIKSKKDMNNFLSGLLTKKEIEEFISRVKIVKMLKQGIPQKKIAGRLGVGIATVTRGSNEVKRGMFVNIS